MDRWTGGGSLPKHAHHACRCDRAPIFSPSWWTQTCWLRCLRSGSPIPSAKRGSHLGDSLPFLIHTSSRLVVLGDASDVPGSCASCMGAPACGHEQGRCWAELWTDSDCWRIPPDRLRRSLQRTWSPSRRETLGCPMHDRFNPRKAWSRVCARWAVATPPVAIAPFAHSANTPLKTEEPGSQEWIAYDRRRPSRWVETIKALASPVVANKLPQVGVLAHTLLFFLQPKLDTPNITSRLR